MSELNQLNQRSIQISIVIIAIFHDFLRLNFLSEFVFVCVPVSNQNAKLPTAHASPTATPPRDTIAYFRAKGPASTHLSEAGLVVNVRPQNSRFISSLYLTL